MAAVTEVPSAPPAGGPGRASRARAFTAEFLSSRSAALGVALAALICVAAVLAPWIAPQDPYDPAQLDIMDVRLPPGSVSSDGRLTFLLGSDDQGRDMLSAILFGLRISLAVGVGSAAIAAVIGTLLGLLAAYAGRRTEALIMRLVDLQLSIPAILLALMILSILGKGIANVMLALILVEWTVYARSARAGALAEIRKEYIEAAQGLGLSRGRIIIRHLLPNCLPPVIVVGTQQIARAIALEATLSFLGLGVPITEPSLGLLISNGYQYMLSGRYWISFYPGCALLLTIVAFNLIGDHLREMLNPRLRR